ncbi:DNA mismatch repair protein MutS [Herbinix luporum]|jgi:DNA mismatch repair protein MutS|uniref:DNA mismatch repair protein MutS n=1 Tax=Herbinix luporum TaxID=1679721 RepID=A0A0K8J5S8_9FIRM|nr:DNA mismatch repair protein MutS [Herbinix luporum]MDI9488190.1 DNA mismatch repair protein MutS [Bacillota bacterium]CUH92683.1 DNA mismatch repair protein MutS [Herbinix luporum]HHT56679.1 DNA mismatch repair protein MutS [Herbinix luporum]
MANLTPLMQQYMQIKEQYKDCILFYRLGDFYEMFFEDAIICSKELEIALTGKHIGKEERAPMCGVPYHAVDNYLSKLIARGYRVAICEQVEDPKTAKGLVKREVVRIVTPGTNLNTQVLDETKNNYLMSVVHTTNLYGISVVDATTGDYFVTEIDSNRKLMDEIYKWSPSEIICNDTFLVSGIDIEAVKMINNLSLSPLEPWYFDDALCIRALMEHFDVGSLDGIGLKDYTIGIIAAGSIMQFLRETQKTTLSHITKLTPYTYEKFMLLDSSTVRNLELTETIRDKQKKGSLLWVLDKTKTAMGARLLRSYVEQPLIDYDMINQRLSAVKQLKENMITREEIREYLNPIYDLERLMGKISYKSANPRDLIAFKTSLEMLPHIKFLVKNFDSKLLKEIYNELDDLSDIYELINSSIEDEPPITIKEGGIIKEGFNEEVDRLKKAKTEGKDWLMELEAKEREATGIKNLRIKYNRVFGYYLEVTKSYQDLVPKDWTRKQTLANAERYTTDKLKELEDIILGAEDKLFSLEYDLFCQIRDKIASEVKRIQKTAKAIAKLDVFASLALVAEQNNYVCPEMNTEGLIDIKNGRHPVVEKTISNDMFVANDTLLDNKSNRISIITGPNMAGKSTYMRQTALIVLMSQIGSFVPADSAKIGIVDRIFTRVGASDDLAGGQSTFMVEMTEVANILRNATRNSLLILDEIGRGTSTFDGLAIAWAVVEHISNTSILGAKTLFATHYHELTELEGKIDGVNNYCIAVKEQGDDIIFLRKIVKGGADKSYGIQVAKLAGVPASVLKRANDIVNELIGNDLALKARTVPTEVEQPRCDTLYDNISLEQQFSLFSMYGNDDIITEIRDMDITNLTPIDAINKLYQLQKKIKDRI